MVNFPRYKSYKESGIEWLREIPSHWNVGRLKYGIESAVNGVWGRDPDDNDNIVCIRVADFIRHKYRVSLEKLTKRKISTSDFQSRQLRSGDLLLEKSGGGDNQLVGQVVLYNHEISAVCSNFLARLRIKDTFSNRFLVYVNACLYDLKINYKHIKQTTGIQNIDANSYFLEVFAYPHKEEQENIANFLDRKTSEIDQALAQKQRLIELLKEQKAIFINQAVTKGLNPNVPLRDSGIEWIGEVPTHWNVIRNRYLFKEQNERSLDGSEIHLCMSQKFGLVPSDELKEKTLQSESYEGAKLCKKADLVLNRLKAHLGVFSVARCDGLVSPDYSVFRLHNQDMTPEYFENLFKTNQYISEFNKRVKGIVVGFYRLYTDAFNDIACLCPPEREQVEIRNWVFMLNQEFKVVENAINTEIEKLTELKTVLIFNSVTGKIKI